MMGRRGRVAEASRRAELEAAVGQVADWFHSLDLGAGVVTPGTKSAEHLAAEAAALSLPDMRGRTVLDIGAWDGYYSFEAERRGASRVVALDHYAWSLDLAAMHAYWDRCRAEGRPPEPYETVPEVWRPDALPGKRGFDVARSALGSRVESVVADFMTTDPADIGSFDVTLFLGVLYHLQDPFDALRRLRRVTREVAVIETACMVLVGLAERPLWDFFPNDELDGDPGNWWAPNVAGLVGACRAAGFASVDVVAQPPDDLPPWEVFHGRAVVHAHCLSCCSRPLHSNAVTEGPPALVWISGASSGIGKALAGSVPWDGARVIDVSRSGAPGLEHVAADLADPGSWDVVARAFHEELSSFAGEVAVFVHAAGTLEPMGFAAEVDPGEYRRNVVLNCAAPQALGQAFVAAAVDRPGRRHLVLMTSGAARSVYPGWSSYGAAKAAVDQWVRNVGAEQEIRGGVRVLAVAPGTVDTPMQRRIRETPEESFPQRQKFVDLHREGKLTDPGEVAAKVWALLDPAAGAEVDNGSVLDLRELPSR